MTNQFDVLIVGAGPAGLSAALRAAELGARTAVVAQHEVGGMAANDGPIPVRVLAQAARLLREAQQLGQYGIDVSEPVLDYPRLLTRVREVVLDVSEHSTPREQLQRLGVTIYENAGVARFVDSNTVETATGRRLQASKIILLGGFGERVGSCRFQASNTPLPIATPGP